MIAGQMQRNMPACQHALDGPARVPALRLAASRRQSRDWKSEHRRAEHASYEFGKEQLDSRAMNPDDPLGKCLKPGQSAESAPAILQPPLLAQNPGFPRCELYWDEASRDRAVARATEVLPALRRALTGTRRKVRAPFFQRLPLHSRGAGSEKPLLMRFPTLTQPATEATSPAAAPSSLSRRTKNGAFARCQIPAASRLELICRTIRQEWRTKQLSQSGYVWQAEEQLQDGKWQRYYGFVGSGVITRSAPKNSPFTKDDDWAGRFLAHVQSKAHSNDSRRKTHPAADRPYKYTFDSAQPKRPRQSVPAPSARFQDGKRYLHPGVDNQLVLRPNAERIQQRPQAKYAWNECWKRDRRPQGHRPKNHLPPMQSLGDSSSTYSTGSISKSQASTNLTFASAEKKAGRWTGSIWNGMTVRE